MGPAGLPAGSRQRSLKLSVTAGVETRTDCPTTAYSVSSRTRNQSLSLQPIGGLPSPCQRPCNVDDVVAASGRVFSVPGNAKPDPKVDAAYLLQLKAAIGKIKRPFRRKADAKPGRDQR